MIVKGTCAECGAELHGRSDKKFCDDQCRSTFNNKTYSHDLKSVKEVNRILASNRRALKLALELHGSKTTWSNLISLGFNPNYCTGAYLGIGQKLVYECYEYSWEQKAASLKIFCNKKGEN